MKKYISCIAVFLILLVNCLIAAFPTSASDINYDDWDIINGVIIEYIGPGGDVVVPSVDINGKPVTKIDSRAFRNNTYIDTVVVSEGITHIGDEAFQYCKNITEMYLPYSLVSVGHSVFCETGIKTLVVPGQLKTITTAFLVSPCTDIVISPGVENISTAAFGCMFSEVILPSSVKNVGALAFAECEYNISIYVCNPNCNLGIAGGTHMAMILAPTSISPTIKIYSTKGSAVENFVKTYQKGNSTIEGTEFTFNAQFVEISAEKLAEYEAKSKRLGITQAGQKPVLTPTKPVAPTKPVTSTTSGSSTSSTTGKENQSGASQSTSSSATANNTSSITSSNDISQIVSSVISSETPSAEDKTPDKSENKKTTDKSTEQSNKTTVIIVVIAAVVIIGGGVLAIVVLKRKKQN